MTVGQGTAGKLPGWFAPPDRAARPDVAQDAREEKPPASQREVAKRTRRELRSRGRRCVGAATG